MTAAQLSRESVHPVAETLHDYASRNTNVFQGKGAALSASSRATDELQWRLLVGVHARSSGWGWIKGVAELTLDRDIDG
jgi:hypothetical protein